MLAESLASTSSPTCATCRLVGGKFAPCSSQSYTGEYAIPDQLFFTPNPYATGLRYQSDDGNVNYNSLQIEARKQTSHGLTVTANLVWSHSMGDLLNASDQTATYQWFTQRNARLSYGPTPFDRRIAFNSFWTYELPVGEKIPASPTPSWTALPAAGSSAASSRSPPGRPPFSTADAIRSIIWRRAMRLRLSASR